MAAVLDESFRFIEDEGQVERIAQILAESGVVTRRPSPSWAEYLQQLWWRWLDALAGLLDPGASLAGVAIRSLVWLLLALAALAMTFTLTRIWLQWRRRARAPASSPPLTVDGAQIVSGSDDKVDWQRELERRLGEGRGTAALEALWWWLAAHLAVVPEADRSWTGRELVRRSGRRDLRPLIDELDRATYGPAAGGIEQIRELFERARREVAA